MSIVVKCVHCGRSLKADEQYAGKRVICPQCKQQRANSKSDSGLESTVVGLTADTESSINDAPTIGLSREPSSPQQIAIPGYEIVEQIGRGGMGAVYKAEQKSLNRLVALKTVLTGQGATERQKQRFVIEAEAVAKLRHRGIVQVYDFGDVNGLLYFTMEYVEGGTLAEAKPTNPRESAAIVMKLAEAVQYAHERGIIHRDLKPGNVLIAEDGTPMITDFGLAKRLLDAGRDDASVGAEEHPTTRKGITMAGKTLGTPGYMSPEQARGDLEAIGTSTDVYALGAILYELLAGKPPFAGMSLPETLKATIDKVPEGPGQLKRGVPLDLDAICLKCLQKDQKDRYESAKELAADLRSFITDMPVSARPILFRERWAKWYTRHKRFALIAGALGAAVLISGGALALVASRSSHQRSVTSRELESERKRVAEQEIDIAIQKGNLKRNEELLAVRDATAKSARDFNSARQRHADYNATLRQAYDLLMKGVDVSAVLQDENRCPADLRDFGWSVLVGSTSVPQSKALRKPVLRQLPETSNAVSIQLAPAGQTIATTSYERNRSKQYSMVTLWDSGDVDKRATLNGQFVAFSVDGTQILIIEQEEKQASQFERPKLQSNFAWYDARNGDFLRRFSPGVGPVIAGPFSGFMQTNGNIVALIGEWPHLACLDQGNDPVQPWRSVPLGEEFQRPGRGGVWAFDPSGKRCAVARWRSGQETVSDISLWFLDALNGKILTAIPLPGTVVQMTFSADGKLLGILAFDGIPPRTTGGLSGDKQPVVSLRASIWDVETFQQMSSIDQNPDHFSQIALSPDGRCLATASNEGVLRLWDPITGSLRFTLGEPIDAGPNISSGWQLLAFSPDGLTLASLFKSTMKLWDVGPNSTRKIAARNQSVVESNAASADVQSNAQAESKPSQSTKPSPATAKSPGGLLGDEIDDIPTLKANRDQEHLQPPTNTNSPKHIPRAGPIVKAQAPQPIDVVTKFLDLIRRDDTKAAAELVDESATGRLKVLKSGTMTDSNLKALQKELDELNVPDKAAPIGNPAADRAVVTARKGKNRRNIVTFVLVRSSEVWRIQSFAKGIASGANTPRKRVDDTDE